jgi:hypothetical protein
LYRSREARFSSVEISGSSYIIVILARALSAADNKIEVDEEEEAC